MREGEVCKRGRTAVREGENSEGEKMRRSYGICKSQTTEIWS